MRLFVQNAQKVSNLEQQGAVTAKRISYELKYFPDLQETEKWNFIWKERNIKTSYLKASPLIRYFHPKS